MPTTAQKPFRDATLVDSIFGGNGSAYILREDGQPAGDRIDIPHSTGNKEHDTAIWEKIQEQVSQWINNGTAPA